MQEVNLKFNGQYNNYSAIVTGITGTLTSNMRELDNYPGTFGGNIRLNQDLKVNLCSEDGTVESTTVLPAGEYQCSARGGQYNSAKHVDGATTQFSLVYREGEESVLITLLNGTPIAPKANVAFTRVATAVTTL